MLSEEADKRSKDLQDQWSKGVDQVKQGYDQAKAKVNDFANKNLHKGDSDMDATKSQYNQTVEHMADNAHSGIESTRDSIRVD
ncbi:hypothetical protein GCM10023189_48840 [Nibrella saemangeumensis]|uniref:Uncharacterized protein n=2 Tax=Nibrella saemangeumensis TaxID=1084526 RepID=A0ABP8NIT6_9BACT